MFGVKPLGIAGGFRELVITPTTTFARLLRGFGKGFCNWIHALRCAANDGADDEEVAGAGVGLPAFLSGLVDECYEAVTFGV